MSYKPKMQTEPPIGLMPMGLWLESRNKLRLKDIRDAIIRCLDYDKEIPEQWIREHKLIVENMK